MNSLSSSTRLTTRSIWVYGSLALPLSLLGYPLGIWLPRAYDTYVGVETALVGFVIFVAFVFDAISDPLMGYASDHFRTRWGRRKPWISVGVPFLAVAAYYLFNPTPGMGVLYLAFWYVFLRLGTTLILVPYSAWGAEISGEYHTRTTIQTAREVFSLLGLITASLIPMFVELIHGDDTTALMVINAYTWFILIALPIIALLVIGRVSEAPPSSREGDVSFLRSLSLMYQNKLFLRLIIIELLITGGESFRNALSLYFMQDYIGAPRAGTLYVVYFSMGLGAIPLWTWIAQHLGKHRSLAGAIILVSIVSLIIFTLDYGQVWPFYVLFAIKGFCFGAFAYLPRAMMADVIDIDTLKSGDARAGSYFSVLGFMTKLAYSVGGFSLVALALVGYDTSIGSTHGATERLWLGVLYAIVPTLSFSLALYLCWTWPLNARRHARLQTLLERRNARRAAV